MRKIFQKYKKISWKINKILGSLEQISEKFVGNIWLIFLQFQKFSVIRVLTHITWRKLKKNFCKVIWESLEKIWERKFSGNFVNV